MDDLLSQFLQFLKDMMPAILVAVFGYQQAKIAQAQKKLDAANLVIKEEQNKDAIEAKYAGKSDADIVAQSIIDGTSTKSDI